jgi:hypothetical protein
MRVTRTILFAALFGTFGLFPACEMGGGQDEGFVTEEDDDEDIDSVESAASSTVSVQLIQKGVFGSSMLFKPTKVIWGLIKGHGDTWESPKEVAISYYTTGTKMNKVLKLSVPRAKLLAGYRIAYKIRMERAYAGLSILTTERLIEEPLKTPTGRMVILPTAGWTCYSGGFYDWEYQISAYDNAIDKCSTFWGKPVSYFWGLTQIDSAKYKADGPAIQFDFAWYTNNGVAELDGWDNFTTAHDGGYKGCYRTADAIVWVPNGYNLLYKMKINKYWEKKIVETPDTKAFFFSPGETVPACH